MKLHILTAVSRPENLSVIEASIDEAKSRAPAVEVLWHRYEDLGREFVGGQHLKNLMLAGIADGWVCILDDDTVMHRKFLRRINAIQRRYPEVEAIVVSQRRTTGIVLQAAPENLVVGMVDAGQAVLKRSLIGDTTIPETYAGDGEWLQTLLAGRDDVHFTPEILSLHNVLSGVDVSETPERMEA